ncbi:hypothetical protein MIND_00542700 [Mycena indigotica]|uniref:Uncharacterized protein n=1 Tax=Mycena indigotica TaxID=2126181 RepID=A0A8H6T035_9AGAR|nr:uncharacterized protein MIND_00542700 [Mycena indigotica]KAF7307482.1 hypothetical protein MIND_00542700 [Mycena indigotica]
MERPPVADSTRQTSRIPASGRMLQLTPRNFDVFPRFAFMGRQLDNMHEDDRETRAHPPAAGSLCFRSGANGSTSGGERANSLARGSMVDQPSGCRGSNGTLGKAHHFASFPVGGSHLRA